MSIRSLFTLLIVLSLSACATAPKTRVSYHATDVQGPYGDVLVIALSTTGIEMFRDHAEKTLVQWLKNAGVNAIPRSRLFRASEEMTPELVLERIASSDIDAVLVVVAGAVQMTDRGPETYIDTRGAHGDYANSVGNVFIFQSPVPNQRMDNLDVNIITNLYDVKAEKRVWTATTTMSNPGSRIAVIDKVSQGIVKALKQDNFF